MSDEDHKSEVYDTLINILNEIDNLPLHPKNKVLLYSRYVLSKISWHFTVSDIGKTWVNEILDNIASTHIRKWLELPISATLSDVLLLWNKYGLNIILHSTKFLQCQTVSRKALKTSPNEATNNLWKDTSNSKNVQYDYYKNTKGVLTTIRKQHEDFNKTWFHKAHFSRTSLNILHSHSTPYGPQFKVDFPRISLTLRSGI